MGFFNGIKRAFGFSDNGDEHDDELDGIDGRAARSPYVNPFRNDTSPAERHDSEPAVERVEPARKQAQPSPSASAEVEEGIVPRSKHEAVKKAQQAAQEKVQQAVSEAASAGSAKVPSALIDDIASVLSAHLGNMPATADSPLRERLKDSENQRRALQSRYNTLTERVASLEGDIEHLEVEKKALQNKLKVAQVQSGAVGDSSVEAQVESIATEYKEKMEVTNALLNEIRSEAARKTQEVEELRQKLDEAQTASTVGAKELAELKEQVAALEKQTAEQEAKIAADAKAHTDVIAEKDAVIASMKDEASASASAKEKEMMAEMEDMLKDVEDFKQKKIDEMEALKQSVAEANKAADEAKEQLLLAQNEKTKLTKQVADLNRRMADTVERHNRRDVNVANQIDHLKAKLKESERNLAERIEALGKSEDVVAALTKERDSLALESQNTAKDYELLRKEYEGAKLVHEEIREESELAKKQIEELNQNKASLATSVEEKDAEIASLLQKLKDSEAAQVEAEKMAQLEKDMSALEKEMTALKAENAQLHQANSVLEQTIDTLSSQQQSLNDLANELILQAEEQPEEEQLIEDLEPPVAEEPSVEMEKAEDSAPVSANDDFAPADDVVAEVEEAAETPVEELPLADDEAPMEAETEAAPEPAEAENAPAEAATSDFGEGIDDFLDDIDWLVPSPPSNKKPQPPEPEPEPVPERKKPDSRQMSLF
ncbi:MAG: hypothetical protein SPK27_07640 [Sodaliphilus sp.]|nr:hypothetical protein [Bacteroidales bacterium]MDY5868033.1 hypothetical protein [Sodaliphilus sp.]